MEPEQEHLSKLYSGSGIHSLPELNPKLRIHLQYRTDFFINQDYDQRHQHTFQQIKWSDCQYHESLKVCDMFVYGSSHSNQAVDRHTECFGICR